MGVNLAQTAVLAALMTSTALTVDRSTSYHYRGKNWEGLCATVSYRICKVVSYRVKIKVRSISQPPLLSLKLKH